MTAEANHVRSGTTTGPHSREVIARTFDGLSDADREKIVFGNAARIYGLGG